LLFSSGSLEIEAPGERALESCSLTRQGRQHQSEVADHCDAVYPNWRTK